MYFEESVEDIGKTVEAAGVGVIAIGLVIASARYLWGLWRLSDGVAYRRYRREVGKAILLGLEFLVAGDIIRTVAVDPTFTEVGVLAAVVGVRTFLSFSLEVELEGRWPWQRGTEGSASSRSPGPGGPESREAFGPAGR